MLAPQASVRDHPLVQILFALASLLVAGLYLSAIVMLSGTAVFHFLIWRKTALPIGPVRAAAEAQMFALVTTSGIWSSIAVLALVGPRTIGVTALLDERFPLGSRLTALVFGSEWGVGLLATVLAALLSLLGYLTVRRGRNWGWSFVLFGLFLLAIGAGLQGHPFNAFAKLNAAPLFDGLHAVGTGGWLGSFFLLVLAEPRLPAHTASPWTDPLGAMIERYFRASGALATVVLLTGLFSSAIHLMSFDDISGTQYGRVLAGKVGIVLIMMAFNEFHRRHAERQARTSERPQLVHTLRFQAGLIGLVLALTAVLVDSPPPGGNEVRSEVFRSAPAGAGDRQDVHVP